MEWLSRHPNSVEVEYFPYDWLLNDRAAAIL